MRLPLAPLRHPYDAEILRLAVPAFGALVAEPLFLLADSAIVGHLGTPELAGLGVAATILGAAVSLSIFLAYGTTAAVARMLGAGDRTGAIRRGIDGLWLAGVMGVGLALTGYLTAATLVGWFDVSPEAAHQARIYLRVSLAGIPAALIILAMTGSLRGLQDTRTPLVVAAAANLTNIGLNFGLVYGLGLGIAGSGLGTVISQWSAATAYVLVVTRSARALGVSLKPDWSGIRSGFTASAPLVVRNLALRGVIAMAAAVAARMGSAEIAAHQVAFTVWTTLSLALDAVAIAGQAIVGRYLGAGSVDAARQATRRMVEWSVGVGVIFGLIIFACRFALPPLFSEDVEVRRQLAGALLVVAVLQPLAGWVFALDGVLIGAGDIRYIAVAQALTVLVFFPVAAAVLYLDLGLTGLWWGIGVWMLARLAVMAWRASGSAWAVTGAVRR
jgi:putative MATE family efflux protein